MTERLAVLAVAERIEQGSIERLLRPSLFDGRQHLRRFLAHASFAQRREEHADGHGVGLGVEVGAGLERRESLRHILFRHTVRKVRRQRQRAQRSASNQPVVFPHHVEHDVVVGWIGGVAVRAPSGGGGMYFYVTVAQPPAVQRDNGVEEVWPGTQVAPSGIDYLNLLASRCAQKFRAPGACLPDLHNVFFTMGFSWGKRRSGSAHGGF